MGSNRNPFVGLSTTNPRQAKAMAQAFAVATRNHELIQIEAALRLQVQLGNLPDGNLFYDGVWSRYVDSAGDLRPASCPELIMFARDCRREIG